MKGKLDNPEAILAAAKDFEEFREYTPLNTQAFGTTKQLLVAMAKQLVEQQRVIDKLCELNKLSTKPVRRKTKAPKKK